MLLRHKHLIPVVLVACALVASPSAAQTINWTTWTSQPNSTTATGTMTIGGSTVNVTYTGEIGFTQLNHSGTNYYSPASTFSNGTTVPNGPSTPDMIAISGTATTHTLTFSTPVNNLFMAIVSMGQPAVGTTYTFDQPFTIFTQGPSSVYGGCTTCLSQTGNTLTGHEGDGVIGFTGPITTLSWTGSNPEFWNGFTVGAAGAGGPPSTVPEPSSLALLGSGLIGLVPIARRRRR
jgi:hypothetical protein